MVTRFAGLIRVPPPLSRVELIIAAVAALSLADMENRGYFSVAAAIALALSLVAVTAAFWSKEVPGSPRGVWRLAVPALTLTWALGWIAGNPWWLTLAMTVAALLVVAGGPKPYLMALLAVMAVGWLQEAVGPLAAGSAHIDVVWMVRDGALRLLHGLDPYTGVYPSTTPGAHVLPFTYSPATAILAIPGAWLGDPRYVSLVLAIICVVALSALTLRSPQFPSAAQRATVIALILAVPLLPVLVWFGWTELYVLAPFLLWLVWRDSHRGLGVACLAVAIGAKFTILPVLVPLFLLVPRMRREISGAGAGAAALIYLPFVLWAGPTRFWADTIGFFLHLRPPPGTLSISGALTQAGLPAVPLWATLVLLTGLAVGLCYRPPTDLGGLLLRAAMLPFGAFLISPWAAFNYWALVGCVLLAAIATSGVEELPAQPQIGVCERGTRSKSTGRGLTTALWVRLVSPAAAHPCAK